MDELASRVSRDLCGSHLKQATVIYHSGEPLEIRQRKLDDLMRESNSCDSCLKLRRERSGPLFVAPDPLPYETDASLIETFNEGDLFSFLNWRERRLEILERKGLLPAPELSSTLKNELLKIQAVPDGRTPASAMFDEGILLPRVAFVTEAYATDEIVPVEFVRANSLVEISKSQYALPPEVRKRLFRTVETSMSSLEFVLIMKDGNRIPYWYSGPNDFADLPEGYGQDDVTDVEFGRGLASGAKVAFSEPEFVYCVYR